MGIIRLIIYIHLSEKKSFHNVIKWHSKLLFSKEDICLLNFHKRGKPMCIIFFSPGYF